MVRVCKKCNIEKSLENFVRNKSCKDGYRTVCKVCRQKYERSSLKVQIREKNKRWKVNNRDKHLENKKRYRERRSQDPSWKLAQNLRTRLSDAVRALTNGKFSKKGSAIKDLGCSIEELKLHLESLFKPGMTWDNYGNGMDKWNIDHIEPISRLDANDPESYKRLCHYSNLQPMWQPDNITKSNKYETS